jgi:hypothetical protein
MGAANSKPAERAVGKTIVRIQAFRVQAFSLRFGPRQPKGWTLNARMAAIAVFLSPEG